MPTARKAGRYDPAGQPAPPDPGAGTRVRRDALAAAGHLTDDSGNRCSTPGRPQA